MSGARSARWAAWLSRLSLGAFAASFLLAMMTPVWEAGTFARLPILRLHLGGQAFPVGALVLVPAASALCWVVARLLARPAAGWRWGPPHVAVPFLAFGALALVRSWPVHLPRTALTTTVGVLVFLGSYLYALQSWPARWAVWPIAVLLALQGGIALLQFARQGPAGLSWLGELPIDPSGQGVSVIEVGGHRWLRAYGLTPHPNVLGGYLGMCALICLGTALSGPRRGRLWLWMALVPGALGLFVTFSRAAWLGTAVGALYLVLVTRPWRAVDWRRSRVRRRVLVAGAVAVVVGGVATVAFRELLVTRFLRLRSPLEATSIDERLVDYRQAWDLIRTVPLKGTGTGYYIGALWAGVGEDRPPGFRRVHSTPLLAAAELGVAGALLWLCMLLAPPVALARRGDRDAAPLVGWAAACVSALVVGLFDSYLYVPATWWPALFLGYVLGVWARAWPAGARRDGGAS